MLGHQDGRGAVAAADVGDERAPLQLVHDPVEGGQPRADQVGVVAGPEEPLAALVHVRHVLVPAEPGPGARRVDDVRGVGHRAEGDLEEPGQVGRAVRIGQRDRLLGRQQVPAAVRVVAHVAACRLGVQPLAHVTFRGAGALGQFGRCQRARASHRTVEAESVAHDHQRRVERGADLFHRAEDELHEFVHVDFGCFLLDGAHDVPPGSGFRERRPGAAVPASGGPPSPVAGNPLGHGFWGAPGSG